MEKILPEVLEISQGRRPRVVCEAQGKYISIWTDQSDK